MYDLHQSVAHLSGLRVVVIGDLTLDEYLYGRATRLSREAPIPVLELDRRELILGGAANPARNVVALGSAAIQIGMVGVDPEAVTIRDLLHQHQVETTLIPCADRPTTRKTRILAIDSPRLPQQLARIDHLRRMPPDPVAEAAIIAALEDAIPHADAVICSDYQLGMLSRPVIDAVRALCRRHQVLFAVDAQGNALYYQGADLFRCNNHEAESALAHTLRSAEDFRWGCAELRRRLNAGVVMITRGPHGIALESDAGYVHVPAMRVSEVYDTTGAGDTFIAIATLALAGGLDAHQAAYMAGAAAAQVVRRFGNAVVTPAELRAVLQQATEGQDGN